MLFFFRKLHSCPDKYPKSMIALVFIINKVNLFFLGEVKSRLKGALHFILLQRASHRQYCALMATHGTSSKASGTSSSQEGTGEGWGRRVTRETRKSKRNSHELKDSANFFSRTGRATGEHHCWFESWSHSSAAKSPPDGWSAKEIYAQVASYHLE